VSDVKGFLLDDSGPDQELWVMDSVNLQNNVDVHEGKSDGDKSMNTTTNFDEPKGGKLSEAISTPVTSTFKEDLLPAPSRNSSYNTAIILPVITIFFIIACIGGCFYSRRREPKARMVSPSGVWDQKVKPFRGLSQPPAQKAGVQLVKFSELSNIPGTDGDNGGDGIYKAEGGFTEATSSQGIFQVYRVVK
jgi:hypothetical protein